MPASFVLVRLNWRIFLLIRMYCESCGKLNNSRIVKFGFRRFDPNVTSIPPTIAIVQRELSLIGLRDHVTCSDISIRGN